MTDGNVPQPSIAGAVIAKIAVVGAAVVALCCFIPLLVVLASSGGIGAMAGYINCVALLPALAIFLALATYAAIQRQKND